MKELSKIKKTILFLNASSYKLAGIGSYKDSFYKPTQPLALTLNWCLEFSLFKVLLINTDNLASVYIKILLLAPFAFHLCIDFIFSRDLKSIENNYEQYYLKYYYITYCILAIIGVIFALYYIFYIW